MPDIKIFEIDQFGSVIMGIPRFNDSVTGIKALAQIIALMLLDPVYGNLESLLKKRVSNKDIGEIILRTVDSVERTMIDEQAGLILEDEEILSSLDISSIDITLDNVKVVLRVVNKVDEEEAVIV